MINFTQLNTIKVLNSYKNLGLFPKCNRKNSIKYFLEEIKKTRIDHNITYAKIVWNNISLKKYYRTSILFSFQDLLKSLNIYLNVKTSDLKKSWYLTDSNKFLNLYYSYLFISRSILNFHGILLAWEKITTRKWETLYKINVVNPCINRNKYTITPLLTKKWSQVEEKYLEFSVNHSKFWDNYYKLIKKSINKDHLLIWLMKIPSWSSSFWYFKEKKYIKNYNASEWRNYYTYKYSTYFRHNWSFIEENVKKSANSIKTIKKDVSELENVVKYNLIYMLALIKVISEENDFYENLMIYLENLKKFDMHNDLRELDSDIENMKISILNEM